MKNRKQKYIPAVKFIITALILGLLFQGCKKEDSDSGIPVVTYVRVTDAAKSDSLLTHAFMGSTIAIIGENLQDVKEIWFNDQSAFVNFSFVTPTSIIVTIPNKIPGKVNNQMQLITNNSDTLKFPFGVDVPAPFLESMLCEHVKDGESAVIKGNFFIDDPSSPLKVFFPGNIEGQVESVSLTEVKVKVPVGSGVGPIQVKTIYGSSRSSFYFRDDRNIILNYDNLTTSGSWRGGTIKDDGNSLDKNYVMLKGELDDNAGGEDFTGGGFVSELWSDANGRPEKNFFSGLPADYLLKFEAKVIEWSGAYLNICFGPWASNVAPYQNQLYWSNVNARGLWKPWEGTATGSFKTSGWITVTIPMTDIKYDKDFKSMAFDPSKAGSLTFWMKGPAATTGGKCKMEIYIDNVRIVHK